MQVNNISTTLSGEGIGSLVVIWDMEYWHDEAAGQHPDNFNKLREENREVLKIKSVEFQILDKIGIDITEKFEDKNLKARLENMLLDEVEFESVIDLKGEE